MKTTDQHKALEYVQEYMKSKPNFKEKQNDYSRFWEYDEMIYSLQILSGSMQFLYFDFKINEDESLFSIPIPETKEDFFTILKLLEHEHSTRNATIS